MNRSLWHLVRVATRNPLISFESLGEGAVKIWAYLEVLGFLHYPGWYNIKQAFIEIHVYQRIEIDNILLVRKEGGHQKPKESAEKKNQAIAPLASLMGFKSQVPELRERYQADLLIFLGCDIARRLCRRLPKEATSQRGHHYLMCIP